MLVHLLFIFGQVLTLIRDIEVGFRITSIKSRISLFQGLLYQGSVPYILPLRLWPCRRILLIISRTSLNRGSIVSTFILHKTILTGSILAFTVIKKMIVIHTCVKVLVCCTVLADKRSPRLQKVQSHSLRLYYLFTDNLCFFIKVLSSKKKPISPS